MFFSDIFCIIKNNEDILNDNNKWTTLYNQNFIKSIIYNYLLLSFI